MKIKPTLMQFCHIETYPRSRSALSTGKGDLMVADDILAEAIRLDGHTAHIQTPLPARVLAGDYLVSELITGFNTLINDLRIRTVDKSGVERQRRVSKDTHVLLAAVYSYPVEKTEVDPEKVNDFYKRAIDFHMKEFGDVHFACEHVDESYLHIHVYTFSANAKDIHPGHKAKKTATQKSADAYKAAMSAFQTRFYEAVAKHFDMDRHGPLRPRVPSKYYKKKKAAEEQLAAMEAEQEQKLTKIREEYDEMVREYNRKSQAQHMKFIEDERLYIEMTEAFQQGKVEMNEELNYLKTQLNVGKELSVKFQEFLAEELDPYADFQAFISELDDEDDGNDNSSGMR